MASDGYEFVNESLLVIGDKTAYVNDQETLLAAAPYVKSGKTLVPLRFMEKALGAEISWDNVTRTATLKTANTTIKVVIGQKLALVDGEPVALDVPAEIKGGLTFVPLRFISENLGAYVNYDAETKSINIDYVNKTGWKEFSDEETGLLFKYPEKWTVLNESDNGFKIKSPDGSIMELKIETRDFDAVSKEKIDIHNGKGWELIEKTNLGISAFDNGYLLAAGKTDSDGNPVEFYGAYIFEFNSVTYTWEFTNYNESEYDILLFFDIFNG